MIQNRIGKPERELVLLLTKEVFFLERERIFLNAVSAAGRLFVLPFRCAYDRIDRNGFSVYVMVAERTARDRSMESAH